jgi:hypothetical protein
LDASDFYSEKYWMNAVEEVEEVEDMEDDDMDMVSDVNSTAGRLICFTSSMRFYPSLYIFVKITK